MYSVMHRVKIGRVKEKLLAMIDALIAAVRAGELDEVFSQAAKAGVVGKAKRAA